MKRLETAMAAVLVFASACACAAELPTAEQVLEKVAAAYASMKSFEAETRETAEDPPASQTVDEHFAMEKSEEDGRPVEKVHLQLKERVRGVDGRMHLAETKIVGDGKNFWRERQGTGIAGVEVRKEDAFGPSAFTFRDKYERRWPILWWQFKFKVIGEDAIGGQKMFVLQGHLNAADPNGGGDEETESVWVGQDDSIVHRQVSTSWPNGKLKTPVVTIKDWVSVKVNQKVDPALFVYTPPEGAKVDDRTPPKPAP